MRREETTLTVALVLPHPPLASETFLTHELRSLMRHPRLRVVVLYSTPDGARLSLPIRSRARRAAPTIRARVGRVSVTEYLVEAQARFVARRLARMLPSSSIDLVHAQFLNFPAKVAVELGHELGVPVTATGHAADYLLQSRERLTATLSGLDHVFAISYDAVAALTQRGAPVDRLSVVRAATDPDLTSPEVAETSVESEKSAPLIPLIVTVARLVEKKGVDVCITAAELLASAGVPFRWVVAGDGPLAEDLAAAVEVAGLRERVEMVGSIPHECAVALIRTADVAVLPCRRPLNGDQDGIPVFLLEAAALGVPVVSTPVGGIPELLPESYVGMVAADDPSAVASAVEMFLHDPGARRNASDALRNAYAREFAPEVQVSRYVEVWRRMTQSGGSNDSRAKWREAPS